MRKRVAYISFPQKHGSSSSLMDNMKTLGGVNISFKVSIKSKTGMGAEAYIDVYNLNREDMQFLTTSAAKWISQQAIIQLYVGYDEDVRCIFSGMVLDAPTEGSPDLVLRIKGISGPEWEGKIVNVQKENLKLMDLIDYAGSVTNYPVNIPSWVRNGNEMLNTNLEEFSYTGSAWGLLDKIQEMCGGFTISEKSVFLSTYNDNIYVWTPNKHSEGKTLLVSNKTGMIGVPHPTSYGCDVKMLLNPTIQIGDMIHLETDRVPIINGDFFVSEITHEGELRGKNWFTTLKCSHTVNKTKGVDDVKNDL